MNRTIDIAGLTKKRESAGARFRLDVPEFYVEPGEFVVIVGASGCGKSTLMDMIALVLRPTSADRFTFTRNKDDARSVTELWDSNNEDGLSRIRRDLLGYVLQAGGLFPYLSVRENVSVPRRLKGLAANTKGLDDMAMAIGLGVAGESGNDMSLLDKKPRHLSGGQRQRAAILRALMSDPAIILADEPTAAVDEITGKSIITQFKTIARQNDVSVVMVTHDRHLVRGNVDRAYTFDVARDEASGFITSQVVDLAVGEL